MSTLTADGGLKFTVTNPTSATIEIDTSGGNLIVLTQQANPGTAPDGAINFHTDGKFYGRVSGAWVVIGSQTA